MDPEAKRARRAEQIEADQRAALEKSQGRKKRRRERPDEGGKGNPAADAPFLPRNVLKHRNRGQRRQGPSCR